jgi:glycosyltransferase involved in cell wall biosynthesis
MRAACAVVLPTRVFGGHEKMLVEWLRDAVARHGLEVRIYGAPNAQLARECQRAGLASPAIIYPPKAGLLRDFFITWRRLGAMADGIPVLLAPGVVQKPLMPWVAALLRGRRVAGYVPMAYSSRHMGFRGGALRDWVARHVVRRVEMWITISQEQRDLLRTQWQVKVPVFVVPNRLALLEEEASPAPAGKAGPLRVLFAGRFEAHQKGLDWLCERLRARRGDWTGRLRFRFKGEGAFQAELLRLSAELGATQVAIDPWGEVARAMAEADVLLLPSRFEGVPLVALEALHYGLPVVASRQAGVAQWVPPSCLFEFGDEAAMWAALEALRDPVTRAAALAHSRERVRHVVSAASFRAAVGRTVAALARMGKAPPPAREAFDRVRLS